MKSLAKSAFLAEACLRDNLFGNSIVDQLAKQPEMYDAEGKPGSQNASDPLIMDNDSYANGRAVTKEMIEQAYGQAGGSQITSNAKLNSLEKDAQFETAKNDYLASTEDLVHMMGGDQIDWRAKAADSLQINQANTVAVSKNEPGFIDYVESFNHGVEAARDNVTNAVLHPIDTISNIGETIWDGWNAIGDTFFGVSTEGSRARNQARGSAVNESIDKFANGDGLTRTEMLTEGVTSLILGGAVGAGAGAVGLGTWEAAGFAVRTPYGYAFQSFSYDALAARSAVKNGSLLYRGGTLGRSAGSEGQFWASESPLNAGYASRYGIPAENMNFNFVETGSLQQGSKVITRKAPGIGSNSGGGIEAVVDPNTVRLKYLHMLEGK